MKLLLNPGLMASVPTLVSLSTSVVSTNGNFEIVSTSFIATFANGEQKILNRKQRMSLGLRKEENGSEVLLDKNTCSLYWKDWSSVPTFGDWDKDFPLPIIPLEIANLLSANSILGVN